jgi:homospermidine synthase
MQNSTVSVATSQTTHFNGRLLFVGCGGVAQCFVQLFMRHVDMDMSKITIVDPVDNRHAVEEILAAGATYKRIRITPKNMNRVLSSHVSKGDMVIDLSVNVGTLAMMDWCFHNNVVYLNTSIEDWGISVNSEHWLEDTLYKRHTQLREHMTNLGAGVGPTMVVEHGANPGLVSHWTKSGLVDIAESLLSSSRLNSARRGNLTEALADRDFARLAMLTGTKAIHISEWDSQTIGGQRKTGEFVSTWSADAFYQESLACAEIAWGTHERGLPAKAMQHSYGPKNQIVIEQRAFELTASTWVPSGQFEGMIIPHGETYTISNHLTVKENDKVVYRPSVYFVYRPTDVAKSSLIEYCDSGKSKLDSCKTLTNEINDGQDELGVLLMGHDYGAWWVGSRLDIHESRKHVRNQNATVLQVAASLLGATIYAIENPNEGFRVVDDLPYQQILNVANPYLGECVSLPTVWSPPAHKDRGCSRAWRLGEFLVNDKVMAEAI